MSNKVYPKEKLVLVRVQDALYDWVRKETEGVIPQDHIFWRDQSEPMPPRPCITMKIVDGPRRTGFSDSLQYVPSTGKYNLGGQREMTLSIQIFGNPKIKNPLAYQAAIDLNATLSRDTVLDGLRANGIAVFDQGQVDNLTELQETEFEDRADFEVLLGVAENVVDNPGIIEHVNVTKTVKGS